MKKIIIITSGIIILAGLSILGMNYYLNSKDNDVVKEHGLSFKYPKELQIVRSDIPDEKYISYEIRNQKVQGTKQSYIQIIIPTEDNSYTRTLADNINPQLHSRIKKINIKGHDGESVKYRVDIEPQIEAPAHSLITDIFLESMYVDSFIRLRYTKNDSDSSLDTAWKIILESLDY